MACVFQGGSELSKYDTDTNWDFRQESNFQWLFGVKEPGCFGAVVAGRGFLFVPKLDKIYETWMGPIKPLDWFARTYEVETVRYVEEIAEALRGAGVKSLRVCAGTNQR